MVGVHWTSWEPPWLYQQQIFYPACKHKHTLNIKQAPNVKLHKKYELVQEVAIDVAQPTMDQRG